MKLIQIISLSLFVLLGCSISQVNSQGNDPTLLSNPCQGRGNGFARDLTSCNHYYFCNNGQARRGVCANNGFFDAEREICVTLNNARCFQCSTTTLYELISVPNACPQFVRCLNGNASLHICPQGLVFDGRNGIRQCNIGPANGSCYRENDNVTTPPSTPACPPITNRPIFFADSRDCSVYYACSGGAFAERRECASGLHFNLRAGVCDHPENAQCSVNRPPTPTTPRPELPGPALPCHQGNEGDFVPHNQNCNLYYICTPNGPHLLSCANGLIFDHVTKQCTLRENGTCWGNTQ